MSALEQTLQVVKQQAKQIQEALGEGGGVGNVLNIAQDTRAQNPQEEPKDLTKYLIDTQAPQETNPPAKRETSTGIKSLDEKIANKNLNLYDYYLARKYGGIDLNVHVNGSLDLNQKVANRTKAISDVYNSLKTLQMGDDLINDAQEQSGTFKGVKRWLNEKTLGFFSLDADEAASQTRQRNWAYLLAQSQMGGKPTQAGVEDAKKGIAFQARNASENTARLGATMRLNLKALDASIQKTRLLGAEVPANVHALREKYAAQLDYIDKHKGKIDYKAYKAYGDNVYMEFLKNQSKEQ
ncbi:Coiled-coil domain-containing protein [Helicobacter felis]|uniref:Coiled-coil domain-containing protein n=1 Tax=Helicobacter felis TaxID=214 RepID=UPI000CF062BF|nr:Coiled-coil domain-containing protein [Helicobacter felis]